MPLMSTRVLFVVYLAVFGLADAHGADEEPLLRAMVSTVVDSHKGGVGGVVVDQLGFVYIGDFHENVWRLNPVDNELTLHVSGLYGAAGNTFDKNGNLYQANFFGNSIERISRSGVRTTVATDNLNGPVGMSFDSDQNLLICSCSDQAIKKMTPDGDVTTFAISDVFSCPNGITRNDVGDFFVVSFSGSKIVRITPDGETSVFADTGGNGVGHIVFVRGAFYATSFHDNKIYRITSAGEVSLFAGTGARTSEDGFVEDATFSSPNGIAVDPTGSYLYVNEFTGDEATSGLARSPFNVRRIDLPRLHKIFKYELETNSVADAKISYQSFKSDPRHFGENTEAEINNLGWTYLLKNEYDNAIATFVMNVSSYPESWRVFSSLGVAYNRAGKNQLAIEALERVLELDPDNARAKKRLKDWAAGI